MNSSKFRSGFTLIEMIVSLAIFSIVAVVALGALVKIIGANQKAQALQAAFTNLNFALESISRELRVGHKYHCVTVGTTYDDEGDIPFASCSINNSVATIAFLSSKSIPGPIQGTTCNAIFAYRFVNDGHWRMQKAEQDACGAALEDNYNKINEDTLTPFRDVLSTGNLTLEDFRLVVTGGTYPRVFLRFKGYAGDKEKIKTEFDVQTTISQRIPD